MKALTAKRLRALLHYDPETGIFSWRVKHSSQARAGDVAGWVESGGGSRAYVRIMIDGHAYLAHRLAWLYMKGKWPRHKIDHRNLDGIDNRWENLRPATKSENGANAALRRDNKSGFKGVCWSSDKGKWRATITHRGRKHHLGYFDCPIAGHRAYKIAAKRLFGEFARAA